MWGGCGVSDLKWNMNPLIAVFMLQKALAMPV